MEDTGKKRNAKINKISENMASGIKEVKANKTGENKASGIKEIKTNKTGENKASGIKEVKANKTGENKEREIKETIKRTNASETPKAEQVFISEMDEYLFGQGTHYEIYKKLGAHLSVENGEKGVFFGVWAPHALMVHALISSD